MRSRIKVWLTGPNGTLVSDADGLRLSIRRSTTVGGIRFMVWADQDTSTPPCIWAAGTRPSALEAMAAAEQITAFLTLEHAPRIRSQQRRASSPEFPTEWPASPAHAPAPSTGTAGAPAHPPTE